VHQAAPTWPDIDIFDAEFPVQFIPPVGSGKIRQVVITPKPRIITQHARHRPSHPIVVVSKLGIWDPTSTRMVAALAKSYRAPIRYIGDLDAIDVIVFVAASLSFANEDISITYGGIDDRWIDMCRRYYCKKTNINDWESEVSIKVSESERAVVRRMLAYFPDLVKLLGEMATTLLLRGKKLELEGVSNSSLYVRNFNCIWRRLYYGKS
jgi:hypothetical protein